MKKEFTNPIIEIVEFENVDIITTSDVSFDPEGIMSGDSHPWVW